MENLLNEDSRSESDASMGSKGSPQKEKEGNPKGGLKRSSLSAQNHHFAQLWYLKDGLKMDQIEEKLEPTYSAEIKKEHVIQVLQKLQAEGYSQ